MGDMRITPKMGLRIWTEFKDLYNHEQLASNFSKLDVHDHTEGRGVQIPTGGIVKEAITESLVANEAITAAKLEAALAKRLLKETLSYGTEQTLPEATTETPSVTRNSIIHAKFTLEEALKEYTYEIKVGSTVIHKALWETKKAKEVFFHTFVVPANTTWEWKKGASGKVESVKSRAVEI